MTLMPRVSLLAALMTYGAVAAPACAQGQASEAEQTESPVYVVMNTTKGDMYLALDAENAPISTENFLRYVEDDRYDGTVFHRVIPNFMIQGGGFDTSGTQRDTFEPIKNEWENGLKNTRGTIAMARTSDPDSATAQFFINVVDNAMLDVARPQTGGAAYAVFGSVVKGMDVADEIRAVPTTAKRGMRDWPVEDVVINEVRRLTDEEADALMAEVKREKLEAIQAEIEAKKAEIEKLEAEADALEAEIGG